MKQSTVTVSINDETFCALIDSGSSHSFIHPSVVQKLSLPISDTNVQVSMASSSLVNKVHGFVTTSIVFNGVLYEGVTLNLLDDLCSDVILGLDFQSQHEQVRFHFGGVKPAMDVCALNVVDAEPPELFGNLPADCKPIATKSRRYNTHDRVFIRDEIQQMLSDGIIEPSNSPWRAQVVVTKDENHKKRLVVDYSQTINTFTPLDAYPLPRIDDFVNNIAKYQVSALLILSQLIIKFL